MLVYKNSPMRSRVRKPYFAVSGFRMDMNFSIAFYSDVVEVMNLGISDYNGKGVYNILRGVCLQYQLCLSYPSLFNAFIA